MLGVFEDEYAGDANAFGAWATDLCDLVAASKGSPDGSKAAPEVAFELLQKVAAAVGHAERPVIREHQRRLEDALIELLLSGTTPPVRLPLIAGFTRATCVASQRSVRQLNTKPRVKFDPVIATALYMFISINKSPHRVGGFCYSLLHTWASVQSDTHRHIFVRIQVRKLCCVCLVRAYAAGDNLPIFSRVAALQGYLASKEVVNRTAPELGRVGALECLAALCLTNGNQLASSIPEIITGAIRLLSRFVCFCASRLRSLLG